MFWKLRGRKSAVLIRFRRLLRMCTLAICAATGAAAGAPSPADSAAALQDKYRHLVRQPGKNQFQRPLYLDSTESPTRLAGDIHAVMDYPFAATQATFTSAANWCDVLILHINTKYCRSSVAAEGAALAVRIGRKEAQPLENAFAMAFDFRSSETAKDYFEAELSADKGPLATTNYRIRLQAVPVEGNKTFLHLSYSYEYGMAGRVAMQAYLATAGRGKVGFTSAGDSAEGQANYIGGVRGVVERNTMRYYLAIDSYLGALSSPPGEQFERRIERWYGATEKFPRQLHEVDRAAYLSMKREEYKRQQTTR